MSTLHTFQTSTFDAATLHCGAAELPEILNEDHYWPAETASLEDCGFGMSLVESLLCECLMSTGTQSGHKLAEFPVLPFGIVDAQLANMRACPTVAHTRSTSLNECYYALTEKGQK